MHGYIILILLATHAAAFAGGYLVRRNNPSDSIKL